MAETKGDDSTREVIASRLLIISGCGIVLVSVVMLVAAAFNDKDKFLSTSQTVFNALLPLFGTWVGTVTAYYFSKANFLAANESVQNLVQMTVDQKLEKLKVGDNMIQKKDVVSVTIPAATGDKGVTVQALLDTLSQKVTRIPILTEQGAVKYVLHQSLIYKYIAEVRMAPAKPVAPASVPPAAPNTPPPSGGGTAQPFNVATLTLEGLIAHDGIKPFATALAVVSVDATVGSAKSAMDRISNCQDVIVTAKGGLAEPMVGWLTNVEIGKLSKA